METQNLPCNLTLEELDHRRDRVANLVRDHIKMEQERKDVAKDYGRRVKMLDEQVAHVAQEIRERAEYREVEVKREKDFATGWENTIRVDTGEVVSQRPLLPSEHQMDLPPVDADQTQQLEESAAKVTERGEIDMGDDPEGGE